MFIIVSNPNVTVTLHVTIT